MTRAAAEPAVAAIVLNYNRGADSVRAVQSLAASGYPALHIVLVDNGSAPDDLAFIKDRCPGVSFVELPDNHGFSRAVNLGAAQAFARGAEHLLLFNNDATIPRGVPVIERLVSELASSPAVGAAGPIVVNDNPSRTVQAAGIALRPFFPVARGIGKGIPYTVAISRTFRFDFLQGSCLLVRGDAFAKLNGLDPDFFFFAEDADLMIRLKAAGYRGSLVSDTYVVHRRSSTIGAGSERFIYVSLRSMLIFIKKHARRHELPSAALTMVALSAALFALSRASRPGARIASIVRAWRDFATGRWGGFDGVWATGYTPPDFRTFATPE